jgi:hypothetical protein
MQKRDGKPGSPQGDPYVSALQRTLSATKQLVEELDRRYFDVRRAQAHGSANNQPLAMHEEIRKLISDAIASPAVVKASEHGARLASAYPLCGMTADDIAILIGKLAAGVDISTDLDAAS